MIFKKQILFSVFLFSTQFIIAQGGAVIKATTKKNKILIGEQFQLTIEANLPTGSIISFISIDSIEHFELLDKPVIDTITKEGRTVIKGVYQLVSFDSGHWVIPSYMLSPVVKTDTIPIDVVFSDFDPNQEYHDIKDILEVKPPKEKMKWWWFAAGGVLLLAMLLLNLSRKKKPAIVAVPKTVIDPYEQAMKKLEQLQREKPESKLFYSQLTDIFRLYIFRRKGILSLQKTTDDIVLQLRNQALSKEQFDKLAQSLRLSDFVKFAKYIPSEDDRKNCFEEIKNAIISIEKSEVKTTL